MNIEIIKATSDDMEYIHSFKLSKIDNVYIIYKDGFKCGIVEFLLQNDYICLELIDVEKSFRRLGIGRAVINYLLHTYGDIFGDCAPNQTSVDFWTAMDAEFEEDLEEGTLNNSCIPFVVYS